MWEGFKKHPIFFLSRKAHSRAASHLSFIGTTQSSFTLLLNHIILRQKVISDINTCKNWVLREISVHLDMFLRIQLIISLFAILGKKVWWNSQKIDHHYKLLWHQLMCGKPIFQSIHNLHVHPRRPMFCVYFVTTPFFFFYDSQYMSYTFDPMSSTLLGCTASI